MNKKIVTGVVVSVVTVLLVTGVVLVASDKIQLPWNTTADTSSPKGEGNTSAIVCDSALVQSYNDAREISVRDNSGKASADVEGLKSIAETIKKSSNYASDPTCQTILFWSAYFNANYDDAKTAYTALNSLHEQRIFADNNVLGVTSMANYEAALASLSPTKTNTGTNGD